MWRPTEPLSLTTMCLRSLAKLKYLKWGVGRAGGRGTAGALLRAPKAPFLGAAGAFVLI